MHNAGDDINGLTALRGASVLLLRHGQPENTPPKSFLGHSNPALAADGWQQADYAGRLLAGLWRSGAMPLASHIWHSDLLRAQQTAQALHEYVPYMSMYAKCALREIDFGAWDGRTFAQVDADKPGTVAAWFRDPMSMTPPQGESLQAVYDRVRAALLQIIACTPPQQVVVLVAHFGSLAMAAGCLLGLSPAQALRVTLQRGACGFIQRGALQWWGRGYDH